MKLVFELLLCLIFAAFPWVIDRKGNYTKKQKSIISIILLVGCFMRLVKIENFPRGFNQDEASIGYEAYSILKYGIDRNGFSFPVHLLAWGSGQNALYAYMIMPFIAIFGLNEFAVRLPMAIMGCITLCLLYITLKDKKNFKEVVIYLSIFAIIPWHILKSRWGLESNVFPDLILWSVCCFILGIKKDSKIYFYIASIILGISTYSYGTSYLFVPIFLILVSVYLLKKKISTIKDIIKYFIVVAVISLPMILFVLINYFDLNTITFLNISIPHLDVNRMSTVTSVNGNIITNSIHNIIKSLNLIIYQNDYLILNVNQFGILYMYSLPLIIVGIYYSIKKENPFMSITNLFLIAGLCVAAFTDPNINRVNVIWIPLIIDLAYGLIMIGKKSPEITKIIFTVYLVTFLLFSKNYFTTYQEEIGSSTYAGLGDAIRYAETINYDNLYLESANQPYIYYLFYTKMDPNKYIEKRVIKERKVMFQKIESIGNVHFNLPEQLEKGNVYIMNGTDLENYDLSNYTTKTFFYYTVVY